MSDALFDLSGQVAIVTGTSRGLAIDRSGNIQALLIEERGPDTGAIRCARSNIRYDS